jgi:hypothetical protein
MEADRDRLPKSQQWREFPELTYLIFADNADSAAPAAEQ